MIDQLFENFRGDGDRRNEGVDSISESLGAISCCGVVLSLKVVPAQITSTQSGRSDTAGRTH
jgi:hypothetical protein